MALKLRNCGSIAAGIFRYAVLEHNGPIAIRYPKGNGAELLAQTQEPVRFHKGIRLCAGNDITIVAAGKMVETSLSIATALKSSGIYADVINARFIKPLDEELIIESIMRTKKAVTIEDNSIVSGLGSGILQMLNQHGLKTDIKIFGFPDRFIEQGKQNELLKLYNLDTDSLIREIKEFYRKTCRLQRVIYRHKILVDVLTMSFHDVQEQLNYVLHQSLLLTDSQYGCIYLYDEESHEFTLNSWTNSVMQDCAVTDRQTKYQLDKTGIWGEVVHQRKPIVVNDFMQTNRLKKGYPEGHVQLQRYMSIPVIFDDKIVAIVGLANNTNGYDDDDVTEMTLLINSVWNAITRREAQALLSFERYKYLQTLVSIGDGVMVVDNNGIVEMLNKVAQRLTGWSKDEASGKHYKEVFILSSENEDHTINDPIADVLETNERQDLENHVVLTSREGQKYNLEDSAAPILDDTGNTIGVVLIFRDVTEKKEQKREIEYLSCHDTLTGLHNRRCFDNNRAKIDNPDNLPLSVIVADINGLKLTNDIFGHTAGDQLIMKAAEILQQVCRQFDVIARVGGDEFILLLPNTTQENAEKVIDRIRSGFADARVKVIKCSISLGLDTKSSPDQNLDEIITSAENAMYKDKSINRQAVNNGIIDTIIETLHSRSPIEKQHSFNVSYVCAKIGTAMNLSEAEISKLGRAGYLHDIGKIVLDDSLLSAEFINEDELDVIRQHALVGYRILNLFDDTVDLAEYVYNHHERWDGTGYPRGLKGAQIPLASRIISIVETYDRILNRGDKPVDKRKADAVETINRAAGTQFDPLLTKLLSEVIEE